ncbi:hypothetical protein NKR23_g6527 [Pleurostoma richardsiae]|uniref:Uncharacterized protein n=1 Tax=Pleurostoma richardsiae TaxID=41990 RepID=A0AA38VP16_9PEZI|nr:hypothetical protein NKR23_g6527 [Pleurostoma richardsiae]
MVRTASQTRRRAALDWLSVAQTPLRPQDLWTALRVGECVDIEEIEAIVTNSRDVDEEKAIATLEELLGPSIVIQHESSGKRVVTPAGNPEKAATTSEAHATAAKACMAICAVTTLHLGHLRDPGVMSSLITYAWTFWNTHLSRSNLDLSAEDTSSLIDSMALRVFVDILAFLLTLNDFITGPITFPTTESRLGCVAAVRAAQQSLAAPIAPLSMLIRRAECAPALQSSRRIFEGSSIAKSRHKFPSVVGVSGINVLSVDHILLQTEQLYGATERQTVVSLAETARGLRAVCLAFSRPPLYEQLLKEFDGVWSPTDILYHTATWTETLARYPYWNELTGGSSYSSFKTALAADPSPSLSHLILARLWTDEEPATPDPNARSSEEAARQPAKPTCVSKGRWHAAEIVYRLKGAKSDSPTFTVNDARLLSQRTSSFVMVPATMHSSGDVTAYISPLFAASLPRFFRKKLASFLARPQASHFLKGLDDFSSGALTGASPRFWPQIKAAILADGYRSAAGLFAIAILCYHVKRVLFPWLGAYMYHSPLEDLRLALGNPDVFLDDSLSFSWVWAAAMYAQKVLFDFLAGLAIGLLDRNEGRLPPNIQESLRARGATASARRWADRAMAAVKVGYLTWALTAAEWAFDRSVSTVAFMVAFARLVRGGDAEHLALGDVLKRRWLRAAYVAWHMMVYLTTAMCPLVWLSATAALRGEPAGLLCLLGVGGGVWAALRYRARLIIALELGGMFAVLGAAAAVGALLAWEFVADPLGLDGSTAAARRVGERARKALPRDGAARVGILRRTPVGAVELPLRMEAGAEEKAEKQTTLDTWVRKQ